MNAEASPPPESITQVASPEQLTAARQARGWSMSDVAAKLGMMPRQIEAIEQGRWEALPGHAFVRGAIRAYGKALQIDVAPLLATLGPQTRPELKPSSSLDSPLPRHGALGFDNGGSGSRIVWIVLGVLGVIAIAMYFGRGADFGQVLEPGSGSTQPGRAVDVVPVPPGAGSAGGASDTTHGSGSEATRSGASEGTRGAAEGARSGAAEGGRSGATEGTRSDASAGSGASAARGAAGANGSAAVNTAGAAAPTTASGSPTAGAATTASSAIAASTTTPAASTTSGGSGAAGAPGTPSAAARGDASTSASASPASGTAPSSAAAAHEGSVAPATADSVVLRFERESWVDVRDATGRVLLMGTQPANSTRELSGQKPYSMTIGNATFVRVEHGGRNIDLGAVTQKGVARVRVE